MIREQELGAAIEYALSHYNKSKERKLTMFVYDHDADLDVTKCFKLNHKKEKKRRRNKLNQQTKEKRKSRIV